jgi:hypothetical protein
MDLWVGSLVQVCSNDRPHTRTGATREVVMRLTAHHDNARALNILLMEIAPVSGDTIEKKT